MWLFARYYGVHTDTFSSCTEWIARIACLVTSLKEQQLTINNSLKQFVFANLSNANRTEIE